LTCHHLSYCFEPFLDLSLPIPKRSQEEQFTSRIKNDICTLEDCLKFYNAEEILDGDDMVTCDKCKIKKICSKKLSVYKYPRVMVVHIKRFRYNADSRQKLSTDVVFPTNGLDLKPFLSKDRSIDTSSSEPVYDLVGLSNHCGSMYGGHYLAHINTSTSTNASTNINSNIQPSGAQWMCFNDGSIYLTILSF
jgi:ubiquitin C-terminal hydrolase